MAFPTSSGFCRPVSADPCFLVTCEDRQDGTAWELRSQNAAAHAQHAQSVKDRVCLAGLMTNDAGTLLGSLLIVAAEDEHAARRPWANG